MNELTGTQECKQLNTYNINEKIIVELKERLEDWKKYVEELLKRWKAWTEVKQHTRRRRPKNNARRSNL